MPKLFISYRRKDAADIAGRLNDRLKSHFGDESVFLDIDSIPIGLDFRKYLGDAVSQCDVLLAVIGGQWLNAKYEEGPEKGMRRLENPNDYVRLEIQAALSRGIPVVPVLVGDARMPTEAELPDDIKELAFRNAAVVRSQEDFHSHAGRVIRGLEKLVQNNRELKVGMQKASRLAGEYPDLAVHSAKKLIESVVREIYERRFKEPSGGRPLRTLAERLIKAGCFPESVAEVVTAEASQSLPQMLDVLQWYIGVEQPDALGELSATKPATRPAAASDAPSRIAVVPKGLRSFDARDANFFLDLLPGPRDKDGRPESISFWKHRIENQEETTFTVGLIYGPSGCGKSSLVKAGLLPRLSGDVISIHVEATPEETESRLLHGLRKRCPGVNQELGLKDTLAALHQNQAIPAGKKVLVVLDQFEQWLHAKKGDENTELVEALRQCDGDRVQCIVMVRDDFWMAVTRFFRDLDIPLVEGQNFKAVDLFPLWHARQVLAAFGRAYGGLPAETGNGRSEHKHFLDQAVAGLAEDGKVICVRLALFAEMMKGKPWTPATLKEVGGTEGVGVTFLEETFSAASAPPDHHYHQKAARAVLKALLPESGTNIKGHMRSYAELLERSGYDDRSTDFADLIRILDSEIRLITPTDPKGKEGIEDSGSQVKAGEKYYQLTHDYLVPSLRAWLTRKQRETRKGRAELRLVERSALWNVKPENQQLPSLWKSLNIWLLTDRMHWTEPQRKMMRQAGRVHGIRSCVVAAVIVVASLAGLSVRNSVIEKQNLTHAEDLVEGLVNADITQVPLIVVNLKKYRRWADRLLKTKLENAKEGSSQRLNMALALLPVDQGQANYLRDQLILVTPQQFPVVRDALLPHKASLVKTLWDVALDSKREIKQRFQTACALATYSSGDERWDRISTLVAGHLVSLQASDFLTWRKALESAKGELIGPLTEIYEDKNQREQNRTYATEALADYVADRPDDVFNLLATAEQFQFPVMLSKLTSHKEKAIALAQAELAKSLPKDASEDDKESLATRQANASVALMKMGVPEKVWPFLGFHPEVSGDPRVRSYIIHWLSPLGGDPQAIVKRLDNESDVTIRRALVLTLGEFTETRLPVAQRQPLIEKLLVVFENEPDAGLHGAVEWLLRKWDQGKRLDSVREKLQRNEQQLQARNATDKRQWYVNTQGRTFVIVDAGTFNMGSSLSDADHLEDETPHRCRIGRRYAIASMEVTREEFGQFQAMRSEVAKRKTNQWVRTNDSPQTGMTWYEAAWYCNWLSEQEKIAPEQWCYEPAMQDGKEKYGSGMKPKAKYLELSGYRLPTEAEWEYACRAGTMTSRYYGLTETLLPNYAWYQANGRNRAWPVASLKPNDFGLFGMLGNAFEWCDSFYQSYPEEAGDKASEDSGTTWPVVDGDRRVLRGGAFAYRPETVRSAFRHNLAPADRSVNYGFRPARTYP